MFAHINIPGSGNFETFGPGTKKECGNWIEKIHSKVKAQGGNITSYCPAEIISNAEAKSWKYRDGTHCFDYYRNNIPDGLEWIT